MVVNDLYLMGIAIEPDETNAPLIVDADTVLPFAICFSAGSTKWNQMNPISPLLNGFDGEFQADGFGDGY